MSRRDDLKRRAELGDEEARIELYRIEGRNGSRQHLETLALSEELLALDPTLGDVGAFTLARSRYEAARARGWSAITRTLENANSLSQLYDAAATLDLTVKVHWAGVQNIDRDHTMVATFLPSGRSRGAPVSAPVLQVVTCVELLAQKK